MVMSIGSPSSARSRHRSGGYLIGGVGRRGVTPVRLILAEVALGARKGVHDASARGAVVNWKIVAVHH
jgi:hypothetical protein